MSSSSLHDISSALDVQRDNHFVVRNGREALARYIESERNERGWSYGEIVRRSDGYIRSPSTIGNIVNGNVGTVSEDTMRGLAKAFKVPETDVFEVYYGNKKVTEDDLEDDEEVAAIFYNYSQLTEDDKRELRAVLRMFDEEIKRRNLKPKKKR